MTAAAEKLVESVIVASDIVRDLHALGVRNDRPLCVHVSINAIGFVPGGPRTIVDSLLGAIRPGGTLMMPAYSGDMSHPSEWRHPAIPPAALQKVVDELPAFDPLTTPTRGMGAVAEYFRTYPGTHRSPHPQSSFCANGPQTSYLVASHSLDYRFGEDSPLARLVEYGGDVLLLGAPRNTVSLFHLVTRMSSVKPGAERSAPVMTNGSREWARYVDIEYPIGWFEDAVGHLLSLGIATAGKTGKADCVMFPAAAAVDTLIPWLRERSGASTPVIVAMD